VDPRWKIDRGRECRRGEETAKRAGSIRELDSTVHLGGGRKKGRMAMVSETDEKKSNVIAKRGPKSQEARRLKGGPKKKSPTMESRRAGGAGGIHLDQSICSSKRMGRSRTTKHEVQSRIGTGGRVAFSNEKKKSCGKKGQREKASWASIVTLGKGSTGST